MYIDKTLVDMVSKGLFLKKNFTIVYFYVYLKGKNSINLSSGIPYLNVNERQHTVRQCGHRLGMQVFYYYLVQSNIFVFLFKVVNNLVKYFKQYQLPLHLL